MLKYEPRASMLKLERALVVFDLETTGVDTNTAKIVEMSLLRIEPDGEADRWTRRFNPGTPIPSDATAIHGISDADVRDCPLFREQARSIATYFAGADVCGYNLRSFDLPILQREFSNAGIPFEVSGVVVDVYELFRALTPHTLESAFRIYGDPKLGTMDAHKSADDVSATIIVLDGMLRSYPGLPMRPAELSEYRADPSWVDRDGKFRWRADGEVVFSFGAKTQGRPLRDVVRFDRGFLQWMLDKDFSPEVKAIVRDAIAGKYPKRETA